MKDAVIDIICPHCNGPDEGPTCEAFDGDGQCIFEKPLSEILDIGPNWNSRPIEDELRDVIAKMDAIIRETSEYVFGMVAARIQTRKVHVKNMELLSVIAEMDREIRIMRIEKCRYPYLQILPSGEKRIMKCLSLDPLVLVAPDEDVNVGIHIQWEAEDEQTD